jgi:hypothetical protein
MKKILFMLLLSSPLFAQQEFRIGWTKPQFDSAFKHYKVFDFSGEKYKDTVPVFIGNYKLAGKVGLLGMTFISDTLVKAGWTAKFSTQKESNSFVNAMTKKYGKPSRVYENDDKTFYWKGKRGEYFTAKIDASDESSLIVEVSNFITPE